MRKLATNLKTPAVGYIGAVLGVIVIASLAFFNLQGMAAKAHRHWDADIDRIIAKRQERKRAPDMTVLARAEMPNVATDADPQIVAITRASADDDEPAIGNDSAPQKAQGAKKSNRRTDSKKRQQHYIPAAFVTLPKFATTAAAKTTTLLRLR